MAELTPSPDYGQVLAETNSPAAVDALKGLWYQEKSDILAVSRLVQIARDTLDPKIITLDSAVTTAYNNIALDGCSFVFFVGTPNSNLSGLIAPDIGRSRLLLLYNSRNAIGIVTLKHNNASSDSGNRIINKTGGDWPLTPGLGTILIYADSSWVQVV